MARTWGCIHEGVHPLPLIASRSSAMLRCMAQVTVYRVRVYDIMNDNFQWSLRMATPKGAAQMGGHIAEDTGIEIDEDQLEQGEQFTPRNFRLPKL